MSEIVHQPGKLDFLIVTKDVSVTEFRRKPSAVWAYLKTPGHVIFFTRRGKRNCAIMSIETHACLSGDYEKTMREIEEAAAAWREEQKALRRARREAKSGTGKDCSNADGAKTPDFFIRDNRTATESIHDILRDYLARATDTMTVEVDAELLMVKMYELLYC